MHEARAFVFRQRATQAYQKAMRPNIPDETRRAWLIIERDWTKMAEREEAKLKSRAKPRRAASPAKQVYRTSTAAKLGHRGRSWRQQSTRQSWDKMVRESETR